LRVEYVVLVLLMGLATYLTRVSFLSFSKNVTMPAVVYRSLKYIPVSILATLIFPNILAPQGKLNIATTNPYIWAGFITVMTFLLSKNQVMSIIVGIASLVLLRTLL